MTTMQSAQINPNLTSPHTFSYKDILVGKLVRAVACSVLSQIVILVIYIFVANVNILHPVEWLGSILDTFTYVSTWIFVIIFSMIIFAQCLICAKDYVLMTSYCSTRFQQFVHVFSIHNFILLSLHVIVGGALTWQILVIGDNKALTERCKFDRNCLVEDTFFFIIGGFWTGMYFFLKVYMSTKQLTFPVIQQKKFLRVRANISILFKESLMMSVWPTFYFAVFYYMWGHHLENNFMYVTNLEKASHESSVLIYIYLWLFSTLYFFSMNLMRFIFYMFLTESVQFPIVKDNVYILTLSEALVMDNLPIMQHLASLDLYLLSQWSPMRRQLLFTLSQPGAHPHYWNALVESIVKLFSDYTDLLKKSSETNLTQDKVKTASEVYVPFSPLMVQSPANQILKFRNIRNALANYHTVDTFKVDAVVKVSHDVPLKGIESIKQRCRETGSRILNFLKIFFGINFLFGELPQVNIQKCMGNGQLIIWATQGIAELSVASLTEDKYGIVQKDLPIIVTSLIQLKQNLDKLNKLPSLSKKAALDDFNYKMKNAVTAAVKQSLFIICLHFGQYLNDLPLSKDVVQYLNGNYALKNYS